MLKFMVEEKRWTAEWIQELYGNNLQRPDRPTCAQQLRRFKVSRVQTQQI